MKRFIFFLFFLHADGKVSQWPTARALPGVSHGLSYHAMPNRLSRVPLAIVVGGQPRDARDADLAAGLMDREDWALAETWRRFAPMVLRTAERVLGTKAEAEDVAQEYFTRFSGEGGCSENGLSNSAAMAEIASHGYFVIADGIPNGSSSRSMNTSDIASMGKPLLAYVDWAIAQNGKSCSAYYQNLDTTKIASNGFSCGGLMAEGTAGDPRITTWGLNSSGLFSANQAFYKTVHTPVLIVLGGSIMLFSKALGHGGDLFTSHGGDFTKIDLAWLNWQLKGDDRVAGKGLLVGSGCTYCTNSAWEVKSMNVQ